MPDITLLGKIAPRWVLWFLLKIKKGLDLLMSMMSEYPEYVQRTFWHKVLLMPIVKRELKLGAYDIIQLEHTNIAHWL